jgi:hypothetical protein
MVRKRMEWIQLTVASTEAVDFIVDRAIVTLTVNKNKSEKNKFFIFRF